MKDVDAPIIPVDLDGVWGSIFSFERGRFLWKLPRSIPYPVTVSFGKPMPPTAHAVRSPREPCRNCRAEAYRPSQERACARCTRSLIRTARRHPFRFAMATTSAARA